MPTYTIDDRKAAAELAAKHGWIAQIKKMDHPDAEAREQRVLYHVLYTSPNGVEVTGLYNALDKLCSASLWDTSNPPAKFAHRMATLRQWLESYGEPEFKLESKRGEVHLVREGKSVAHAYRSSGGRWFVHSELTNGNIAMLGGDTIDSDTARNLAIGVLKALAGMR